MSNLKEKILSFLPEDFPWRDRIHWFDTIGSTNTEAKPLAAQGAPDGTVLIADRQTGGRGRRGRSFQSPGGMGIYMSVLLRFPCTADKLIHLTCAAAAAACTGIEKTAGFRPSIKWTNDLVFGQRKLAGILTELVSLPGETCAVIGIGINCCQQLSDFCEEIRGFAGSLQMAAGHPVDRAETAASLLREFEKMSRSLFAEKAAMLARYRRDCVTLGKEISLLRSGEVRRGTALDIDENGALIVRFSDGKTEAVSSGEVSIRGMYGYL